MGNQLTTGTLSSLGPLTELMPTIDFDGPLGAEAHNIFSSVHARRRPTRAETEVLARCYPFEELRLRPRRQSQRRTSSSSTATSNAAKASLAAGWVGRTFQRRCYSYTNAFLCRDSTSAPSQRAEVVELQPSQEIVVKIFVYAPPLDHRGEAQPSAAASASPFHPHRYTLPPSQRRIAQHLRSLMNGVGEQMRAVDATLHPSTPAHILYYRNLSCSDEGYCSVERPYVAYSLPERLTMRPYWSLSERLFVCYQLLQAVMQLHEVYGVIHGDIKANNVLLSSTGWLYLTDLAPYKAAYIPTHNPAMFHFYYDSDDSRVCCVAPEKFSAGLRVDPVEDHLLLLSSASGCVPLADADAESSAAFASEANINLRGHTAAMDVFSTGCVMAHILLDEPLLHLAEALALRSQPTAELAQKMILHRLRQLEDEAHPLPHGAVEMLLRVLHVDPGQRPTAREAMEAFLPSLFPQCFSTLAGEVLPSLLSVPPDVQAQTIHAMVCNRRADDGDDSLRGSGGDAQSVDGECSTSSTSLLDASAQRIMAQVLLPVVIHAMRVSSIDDSVHRAIMTLHAWATRGELSLRLQLEVVLPHVAYVVNAPCTAAPHTRALALRTLSVIADGLVAWISSCEELGLMLVDDAQGTAHCSHIHDGVGDVFDDDRLWWTPTEGSFAELLAKPPSDRHVAVVAALDDLVLPCLAEVVSHVMDDELPLLVEMGSQLPRLLHLTKSLYDRLHRSTEEVEELLNNGWLMLQVVYCHNDPAVVQAVLHETIYHVAPFLGISRVMNALLPLLTTFVGSSSLAVQRVLLPLGIALHHSRHHIRCDASVEPLLLFFVREGLGSGDAVVVMRVLNQMQQVCSQYSTSCDDGDGPWPTTTTVVEMCLAAARLLDHSWMAVRRAACGVVEEAARRLPTSVLLADVLPAVRPFLRCEVPLVELTSNIFALHPLTEVPLRTTHEERLDECALVLTTPAATTSLDELAIAATSAELRDYSYGRSEHHLPPHDDHLGQHNKMEDGWSACAELSPRERLRWMQRIHTSSTTGSNNYARRRGASTTQTTTTIPASTRSITSNSCAGRRIMRRKEKHSTWSPSSFTRVATTRQHTGGIYTCLPISATQVLSAGGRGEIFVWKLSTTRVPIGAEVVDLQMRSAAPKISSNLYSCGAVVGHSQAIFGGSDGVARVLDVEMNAFTYERRSGHLASWTAAARLQESVVLLASSTGELTAMDLRMPQYSKPAWSAFVDPTCGALSCMCTMEAHQRACAVAAATCGGVVFLYDLRLGMEVARYPWQKCGAPASSRATFVSIAASPLAPGVLVASQEVGLQHLSLNHGGCWRSMGWVTRAGQTQPPPIRTLAALDSMAVAGTAEGELRCGPWIPPRPAKPRACEDAGPPASLTSSDGDVVAPHPLHHRDAITALAVAPEEVLDSRLLLSGSRDGCLSAWAL